ncbi:MAG: AAA family ATPase [Candidatus Paceibacterota bacterium]
MTQKEALKILQTGANVFITGEPGSGKTHTLRAYVAYLKSHGLEPAVTASTGIAATHISGQTVHSWSGLGIKDRLTERDIDNLIQNKNLVKRVRRTPVLIIDEISMLSGNLLMLLDRITRAIRQSERPFGGLQVILAGDFFQLPPIVRRRIDEDESANVLFGDEGGDRVGHFAFEAPIWQTGQFLTCYLAEQYRQTDQTFLSLLSALRRSNVSSELRDLLTRRLVTTWTGDQPKLFTHNVDVDRINDQELHKLPGAVRQFTMTTKGRPYLVETLKRSCLSPETLKLKIGAAVVFTKNSPEGKFVNGTLGEVVAWRETDGRPIIKTLAGRRIETETMDWTVEEDGKALASVSQLPLRLAWALTVHKSQGMSLDGAVIDLSQAFEYGQGYVALSRLRSLDGLQLLGFNDKSLLVHPTVSRQDEHFINHSTSIRQAFADRPTEEIEKMRINFIKAVGGHIDPQTSKAVLPAVNTYVQTKKLILAGRSIVAIARERKLTVGTIISHLEKLIAGGDLKLTEIKHLKPPEEIFRPARAALLKSRSEAGQIKLTPAKKQLNQGFTFEDLRLVRLFLLD